ncbi:MAG: hypothetical protein AB8B57_02465 [Congregibacter sp.]
MNDVQIYASSTAMIDDTGEELRELATDESAFVSGGFLPLIMYGIAAYGHFAARTSVAAFLGRAGFIGGTFETAKWMGSGGGEPPRQTNNRGH